MSGQPVNRNVGEDASTRTISHHGRELGEDNVVLQENTPETNSPILKWQLPRKFTELNYSSGRHETKFEPRTVQEFTGTTNDDTEVALDTHIQPIAGEAEVDDQPYPAVVAYNATKEEEVGISDVDYYTNTVHLTEDPDDGDEVKLYPILAEGILQYRGFNRFDHDVAPVDKWGVPMHVFHDYRQKKQDNLIHLTGGITIEEQEQIAVMLHSEHKLVWEDEDYPRGQYVSKLFQPVDIRITTDRR